MCEFDLKKFKCGYGLGPVYSWVWNSEIDRSLISSQLEEMASVNIKAFYIIPEPKEFRPGAMNTYLEPDYLSNDFFEMIKFAKSESKRLGMTMWLYDEGGWPSGRACGQIVKKNPSYKARKIGERIVELNNGDCFNEPVLAAFNSDFVQVAVPYTAKKNEKLYVYFVDVIDSQLIDILNKDAIDEFVNGTYERYKDFLGDEFTGNNIAFFTDEAILTWPFYTDEISRFEEESGFDFACNIPALFERKTDLNSKRFRIEYIDFCSKEAEKTYLAEIHNWCMQNKIMFTGHMDGDHVISDYQRQIGNALRHLRNMDIPGVDVILRQIYPGKENTFFPRIASSAANQTGKKYSLSESFAVYGDGLTFDEMRYICNYQFVRGINIINIMNIPSGRDRFLSSQMRPNFAPDKLNWYGLKEFNEYLSRMMYLCTVGDVCVDTALYMPIRDMWAGNNAELYYLRFGRTLESNGIYFDIIDDDFLENCELAGDKLIMGKAEYTSVCIPEAIYMSDVSVKKLDRFKQNGGKVLYSACDIKPSGVNNSEIRVMKRSYGNIMLYFMFNESCDFQTIKPNISEKSNCYILSCETGRIAPYSKESVALYPGECTVLIFGENLSFPNNELKFKKELITTLDRFEKKTYKTSIFSDGEYKLLDGESETGGGKITKYKAEFECENSADLILKLKGISYFALVKVNGNTIKNLIFSPYECKIDSEYLMKHNVVEVLVSDNPAKTLTEADYSKYSSDMTGWYHGITLDFEKEKNEDCKLEIDVYSTN